ncbi:hypothetical protein PG994_000727 [Apiospora phragmitis]|uniref:Uncharacterized protein n=1 Tax=Apiospora phragmitis TaxID=2905665 RepID=A0ABR1X788_9PEZI
MSSVPAILPHVANALGAPGLQLAAERGPGGAHVCKTISFGWFHVSGMPVQQRGQLLECRLQFLTAPPLLSRGNSTTRPGGRGRHHLRLHARADLEAYLPARRQAHQERLGLVPGEIPCVWTGRTSRTAEKRLLL